MHSINARITFRSVLTLQETSRTDAPMEAASHENDGENVFVAHARTGPCRVALFGLAHRRVADQKQEGAYWVVGISGDISHH